jgi:hypothetical protein
MKIKIYCLFTSLFHHLRLPVHPPQEGRQAFIPSSFEEGKPSRYLLLFNVLHSRIGTEWWLKTF